VSSGSAGSPPTTAESSADNPSHLPPDRLCQACLTGHYSTAKGEQLYQVALRNRNGPPGHGRTYELEAPLAVPAKPC
jgi:hypothetical protein